MPFVRKNETLPDLRIYSEKLEEPLKNDTGFEYEPTFIEAMGAKVLTETSIGSIVANKTRSTGYFDPNFDWASAYNQLPAHIKDNYGDLFTEAESEDHFNSIKDHIDFKEQNNEIIRANGWSGVVAGFAAQAVEPLNLVPFGTAAKLAVKSKSILTGAAQVALAGMTSTTTQEAVIQSQDLTRTYGESAANIAASTLLSGVIGGALYKSLAKADPVALKDLEDKVEKSMEVEETSILDSDLQTIKDDTLLDTPESTLSMLFEQREQGLALEKKRLDSLKIEEEGIKNQLNAKKPSQKNIRSLKDKLKTLEVEKSIVDQNILNMEDNLSRIRLTMNVKFSKNKSVAEVGQQAPIKNPTGADVAEIKASGEQTQGVSLSAAATMDTTLDEETIQNALGLEKLFGFQDPGLRLLQSPSVNSRRFFQQIAEVPFKLKKNWKNIPTEEAAESRIKGVLDGRVASAVYQNNMAFKKYKQRMQGDLAKDRLSKKDFDKNVAYAIRRGLKSDIPEVLESASFFHKNIYKYVAEEGGKIKGFFDADDIEVLFKKPYLNRIYDTNQVLKNSSKFVGKAMAWLKREAATSKSPAKKAALEYIEEGVATGADFFAKPAQSIMRNVVGARTMVLQNRIGITSGPKSLKGRKFTIDDLDIEEFLESDINTLARVYAGSMFPRLELARRFGVDFLDDTFTEAKSEPVKAIRKEYADEISKVIDNPKKVNKLLKQEEKDITDLLAVRDRLLGSYGASANPSSWLHRVPRMIKQLNVLRMLGSATAAAVSDVARLVGINGATYAFKDGLVPLLKLASSPEGRAYFSKYKSELRAFNIGTELLLNNLRERGISGLAEDFAKNTKVERGLDILTSQFMNYSLVGHWNTAFKTLAAMVIQNNVHRAISKVVSGKIKPKELAKLNSIGIDANLAKQIYAQVQKHGTDFKGLVMPNVADWDEGFGELGEMYASAIKKEADIVILTPGVATTPLWMSRGGLGLLGQFKSFALSSVQKTIIPMAQNRDFVTAQAMLGLVGMGILSGFLKAVISGKDFSTEPKQLIVEGVDRSGITAWVFDADHMIEAASGNRFGLSHVFGTAPVARYAQRGRLESILGPTGKLASDAMIVTGDVLSGDVRQSTTSKFRQMLPYQNWFGTRIMLDKMEEEFNNSMGITKK